MVNGCRLRSVNFSSYWLSKEYVSVYVVCMEVYIGGVDGGDGADGDREQGEGFVG